MQPLNFDGANVVFAANQPEYEPLPAEYVGGQSGEILTCWVLCNSRSTPSRTAIERSIHARRNRCFDAEKQT